MSEKDFIYDELQKSISRAIEIFNSIDGQGAEGLKSLIVSKNKLNLIREKILYENIDDWESFEFETLDVGLQAAKSLDLIAVNNSRISQYVNLLHRISYLVLHFYGQLPRINGKKLIAFKFYKIHGYSREKSMSHMRGINFDKPIVLTSVSSDKDLWQYSAINCVDHGQKKFQGDYYSPIEGIQATFLGINAFADCNDQKCVKFKKREEYKYRTNKRITVLHSIAKSIYDYWSVTNMPVITRGGAEQYFYSKNKEQNIELQNN